MIHIKENSNTVKVPKHTTVVKKVRLVLIQGQEITELCSELEDNDNLEFFYVLTITNYPKNIGEYEYRLLCNDVLVESGLLVYGNYVKENANSIDIKEKNIQLKHKIF